MIHKLWFIKNTLAQPNVVYSRAFISLRYAETHTKLKPIRSQNNHLDRFQNRSAQWPKWLNNDILKPEHQTHISSSIAFAVFFVVCIQPPLPWAEHWHRQQSLGRWTHVNAWFGAKQNGKNTRGWACVCWFRLSRETGRKEHETSVAAKREMLKTSNTQSNGRPK